VNRTLIFAVSLSFGIAAFTVACSGGDSTPAASVETTTPQAEAGNAISDDHDLPDAAVKDSGEEKQKPEEKDAGNHVDHDAGGKPKALTKAQIQTLVNSRCTPCHVGNASAGMSLANDFTTATVNVASTELPSMKRIHPGDKESSYLFHKIRGTHLSVGGSGARMPKSGPPYLADADIDGIGAFIDGL
jgi:hypothetical protein